MYRPRCRPAQRLCAMAAVLLAAVLLVSAATGPVSPAQAQDTTWSATLAAAREQTVYWNAWAGDERITFDHP